MADVLKKTYDVIVRTGITCRTEVYQVSQNTSTNSSITRTIVKLLCTNGSSYHLDDDGIVTIKVAGITKASGTGLTGFDFRLYTSITIFNDTFTVYHDSDGTFTETFSTYCKYSTYAEGAGTGSVTLTTIPRASILSTVPAFNIEDGVIISYTAYASFTEKLDIYLGTTAIRTGFELASGSKVEFTEEEILKFYDNIADLTGTVTFNLKTYSGSTQIGSTSTKTATGTIAGFLRKGVSGAIKRCVTYKNISGSIKKCIPYIGIGGVGKRGIY